MYDVLIVGAGPAGSTAAESLASSGWRVAVLEEHPRIGDPVNCSGVIGVEAFRRYALPEHLIRHTLQTVRFQAPGGLWWNFHASKPLAHAVDRTLFDRVLARRAGDAGADLRLGHRVIDVHQVPDGVRVLARVDPDGEVTLGARAVILATGAGVPLLAKLGWGRPPEHLLGVQTVLPLDVTDVEVHLGRKWAPEGFGWVVPVGRGMAKVGLLCQEDGPRFMQRFLQRPDVSRRIRGEAGPILCSVLPLGFLPRTYADRILVVGEAAGHIKATTCGGIYYGMLTAGIAAEVLDGALEENRLDAGRLSDYERRWRALLEDEIQTGLRLRRAVRIAGDLALDRLVALASRNGILHLIQEKADFDWHRELIRAVAGHARVSRLLGLA